MKTKLLAAALMFVLAMATSARAADDWKEFKSDSGGFSILMPGSPKEEVEKLPTAGGDIESHLFMVETGDGAFGVMYNDYPKGLLLTGNLDKMMDNARDTAVKSTNSKLRSEKKITLNGISGRELTLDGPNDVTGHQRFFLVKNRLYQLMVVTPKGKGNDAEIAKMLDSFKLTEK